MTDQRPLPGSRRPPFVKVVEAVQQLEALVAQHLPVHVRPEATWWDAHCAAMISRMVDSVESIVALVTRDRAVDASALIRVLYEAVTKFCWIAAEPDIRYDQWQADAILWDQRLLADAREHGFEMEDRDTSGVTVPIKQLPSMAELATQVDEYWGGRLVGFQPAGHGLRGLVTFREMYLPLYRMLSETVHSRPEVMHGYMAVGSHFWQMGDGAGEASIFFPLVVPLYAQALIVCHERLGWPDPERVVAINNRMYDQ